MVLGGFLLVVKARFFFLQMARVRQYDRTQIDGWRRGKDWPLESSLGQPESPATVIEMSVRQNYRVNIARRNGNILPVAKSPFLLTLKKAAVDKHLHARFAGRIVARVDEVFRSGYGPGSAEKVKVCHSVL